MSKPPIIIANLDPPVVPNNTVSPRLWTKPEYLDGTRPGVTPPPEPPGGLPDWPTLLARTGTGTPDATFNPSTDITYLGAFRIPFHSNAVGTTRELQAIAFNPPNGNNGAYGSIFFGGRYGIGEFQIPALSNIAITDASQLNATTVLQPITNIYSSLSIPVPTSEGNSRMGWLKVINNKLYGSLYEYYSPEQNNTNMFVINSPSDLTNSTSQGLIDVQGGDKIVRYMSDIPVTKQSMFGNQPYFCGNCLELALVARASFGPSFYAFNPESLGVNDTILSATKYTDYPATNPINLFSPNHEEIVAYYEGLMGVNLATHCALPDGQRNPQTFNGLTLPNESIRRHVFGYNSGVGFAFIPPDSNTLMLIGNNTGMRFGKGYKNYFIEDGPDGYQGGGFGAFSKYDFDSVYWTMNLSDISNSVTGYDVDLCQFGIFQNNRWMDAAGREGGISSGDYDRANNKLYLCHYGAAADGLYERQSIISVYQVGAS
jgi:hypothetical protein